MTIRTVCRSAVLLSVVALLLSAGSAAPAGAAPQSPEYPLTDLLTVSQIKLEGAATSRDEAIREAGQILVDSGAVKPEFVDAMVDQEKLTSTYMGNFLAVPHGTKEAKDSINTPALSVVRYEEPIDWDGNEVRFAVGIAGYEGGHLDILSKVAIIFNDTDEVDKLVAAGSAQEVYDLLSSVNEDDDD